MEHAGDQDDCADRNRDGARQGRLLHLDGRYLFQIAEDRIQKIDPETGRVLATIPAPGGGADSGLTWAEGTLWVGQYRDRKIHQIDPEAFFYTRAMGSGVDRARPRAVAWASSEESRAFLQERLALFGKSVFLITAGFSTAANLASIGLPNFRWSDWISTPNNWITWALALDYLALWLICRRGRLPERALAAIDAAAILLSCLAVSFGVFFPLPGELEGGAMSRMLVTVILVLVTRAVIVPSSARRTFAISLAASVFPVVTNYLRSRSVLDPVMAEMQAVFTFLWFFAGVVVATLASRVIFGLRQQVREAARLGQYTLVEKVGEGGMGAVYRASHAMLRRPTAVKLLPPEKAGAETLERFEREVQLTSRLTHPNTVAIFDYGRTPDGVFYYAMEYLEGLNLEELVRLDGPQPPGRVVHVLKQVAGALAEAHGVGLIHRDIKPANVILVPERGAAPDVAKVVDFGLVKDLDRGTALTLDGRIAGTPLYFSPESITTPANVDARSDLYSLGAVGYLVLTGKHVFDGRTVLEVCGHHLHTAPRPPAERLGRPVPEKLSALLLDCLEKDPARRPQSARALLTRLDGCDDVVSWSEEEARAWWRAHPSRPSAPPDPETLSPSRALTVSVVRM